MTRHSPHLGRASDLSCMWEIWFNQSEALMWFVVHVGNLIQPIRSTAQIWVVKRHQCRIAALVSGKPVVALPNVGCFLWLNVVRKRNHDFLLLAIALSWKIADRFAFQRCSLNKQTWWSNDKTTIELDRPKILRFGFGKKLICSPRQVTTFCSTLSNNC